MLENPYIDQCPLFQGLSREEKLSALTFFDWKIKKHEKGEFLHQVSFPLQRFGLVLSGTVQVYMDDRDGHQSIMNHVSPGELFGEAYSFLGTDVPLYICAVTEAEVLWLSTSQMQDLSRPYRALERELSNRFIACLAARTLKMNRRVQILSMSSLRMKLLTFLSQYMERKGEPFSLPFDRANMAAYLGADRSALSRELSRMQEDGLITYQRNRFTIL